MLPWPFGERVTVQRGTPDRFNDMVYTDDHQIDGVIIYPTSATEQGTTNTSVTDNREMLAPPGSDVRYVDRILIHPRGGDGLPVATVAADDPIRKVNTYQVLGAGQDWQNPFTGWHPGMQFSLERIT
jgi:hypothetical protein